MSDFPVAIEIHGMEEQRQAFSTRNRHAERVQNRMTNRDGVVQGNPYVPTVHYPPRSFDVMLSWTDFTLAATTGRLQQQQLWPDYCSMLGVCCRTSFLFVCAADVRVLGTREEKGTDGGVEVRATQRGGIKGIPTKKRRRAREQRRRGNALKQANKPLSSWVEAGRQRRGSPANGDLPARNGRRTACSHLPPNYTPTSFVQSMAYNT